MSVNPSIVLITGCSSGFGMLTAALLASKNHIVYASMRDISKKANLLQEFQTYPHRQENNLKIIPLDVTSVPSIDMAIKQIIEEQGRIDTLINNAGFGIGGFFEDVSSEQYQQQFDVNFFGVLNVTKAVVPHMRKAQKGLIINVSSLCAYVGTPAFSSYVSSKWALEGFSECLLMEMMPFNIDVVLLQPGAYPTKIFFENARFAESYDSKESPYYQNNQFLRSFIQGHIQKNHHQPIRVAQAIEKIIHQKNRSFRYVIGFRSRFRAFLSRCIPTKIYAQVINFFFKQWEKKHVCH